MHKPNIILTGFMGTGKTTIGKRLAQRLGYDFIDTDDRIEQRTGKTVPAIFRDLGETAFRKMEAALVRELAGLQGKVIATGGRLMLDPGNAALLAGTGRVFCLIATPEEVLDRISRDTQSDRPLLAGDDPMARITELLDQRRVGYAQFTPVMTSGKTPDQVADTLLQCFMARNGSADAGKTPDTSQA